MPDAPKPKRLGEILIDQNLLKETDLQVALQYQKEHGGLVGEILVQKGFVTEEDVVVALAHQLGYPYLAVSSFVINREAARKLPFELAARLQCIAVDKVEGALAIVMADPSNAYAVKDLEKAGKMPVQTFVGTVSEIEAAIERCYGRHPDEVRGKSQDSKLSGVLRQAAEKRKK